MKPRRVTQPAGPAPGSDAWVREQLPELLPGQSVELLKALHILTRDARLNQDSRRKLKQVNHLMQFIEPLIDEALAQRPQVSVADHGAGKSYLGFMLYDRCLRQRPGVEVIGVEWRDELVQRSRELATRLGFERMRFHATSVQQAVANADLPPRVDVVTALHACDTATDDAIDFALARQASHVVLVPCCQAELARSLRQSKALSPSRPPLAELWRHPLHTREFGSQLTNVLRCLRLEASGFQVTVTELVGWEHSMKNELILARRVGGSRSAARERLDALLGTLGLETMRARFAPADSAAASDA